MELDGTFNILVLADDAESLIKIQREWLEVYHEVIYDMRRHNGHRELYGDFRIHGNNKVTFKHLEMGVECVAAMRPDVIMDKTTDMDPRYRGEVTCMYIVNAITYEEWICQS